MGKAMIRKNEKKKKGGLIRQGGAKRREPDADRGVG